MSGSAAPVAVLGAGRMGSALAAMFAAAGHPVRYTTSGPVLDDGARARIAAALAAADVADAPEWAPETAAACAGAELVVECLPEQLELKRRELAAAAAAAPRAALATNTSTLPLAELARALPDAGRLVAAHFLYPPSLFGIVELAGTDASDPAVLAAVRGHLLGLGLEPIELSVAVPGLIINRLQFALLREASQLVRDGVASAADVDAIVSRGLAPRWVAAGPITTAALGGRALFDALAEQLFADLCRDAQPAGTVVPLQLADEQLARAARVRDARVAAVMDVVDHFEEEGSR